MEKLTHQEKWFIKTFEPRLKGPKWKFCLVEGLPIVISVGLVIFLMPVLQGEPFPTSKLLFAIPFLIGTGVVFGFLMRKIYLRQFNKLQKKMQG